MMNDAYINFPYVYIYVYIIYLFDWNFLGLFNENFQ